VDSVLTFYDQGVDELRADGRRLPVGVLAALTLALCAGVWDIGSAQAATVISFRTPSGNIGCLYSSGLGAAPNLRCDIRSRLVPRPRKPRGCTLDWGDSYEMNVTGRVGVTCHGDTAILPTARKLRYGTRWSVHGFVCRSRLAGLRCRNRSGHGFFLSRQHSNRF
jgi:hypothetical protein